MKYAGTMLIVDEDGNSVHERELTADEMIEELLKKETVAEEVAPMTDPRGPVIGHATEVKAGKEGLSFNFKKHIPEAKKGAKVCKACGVPGHMQKTCPEKKGEHHVMQSQELLRHTQSPPEPKQHDVLNMSPLSKQNYGVLKEMQTEGADPLKATSYLAYTFDRKKMIAQKMQARKT
jgi:hypothetical protein